MADKQYASEPVSGCKDLGGFRVTLGCLECSFKEHPDPRSVRFFSLLLTMGLPLSHAATNEAEESVKGS